MENSAFHVLYKILNLFQVNILHHKNQRMINVSAIYDDCQLICKITNTAALSTTDLQTTKDDKENHGFGLENIKQALPKYNHVLKIDQSDNEFVLSFIIFNC